MNPLPTTWNTRCGDTSVCFSEIVEEAGKSSWSGSDFWTHLPPTYATFSGKKIFLKPDAFCPTGFGEYEDSYFCEIDMATGKPQPSGKSV